jgi:MFS family permease
MSATNATTAVSRSPDGIRLGYVLTILAAIGFLNYYDRNLIIILLQPIKQDLKLSDSAVGLLAGPAFAIVYCTLGIPIARFADRGYRVKVLSAALAVWSAMTSLCGFAVGLGSMALARFGVGVGEAAGLPSTHALIAEYFPPERRASAMSVIAVVASVGVMAGTVVGGVVNDHFGWRAAFMLAGIPGFFLALLTVLTLREPRPFASVKTERLGFFEAFRALARRRSFLYVCGGMAFTALGEYALQTWSPTYLIRHFGMSPGQLGLRYSLPVGIVSTIGMLGGGLLMDRWIKRDVRASIWILIVTFCAAVPLSLITFLTNSFTVVYVVAFIGALFSGLYIGPNYALIQGLAGAKMRATAAATYMMIVNLVGLGCGPLAAGLLSDFLSRRFGPDGLRYALCCMLSTYVVGIVLFLKAAQTVRADLEDAARD